MRDRTSKPQEQGQAIDLTPMLDVVFIMLIFFIVTTSFVKESGININRPDPNQSDQKPNPEKKNVFIKIDATNRVYMDNLDVDIRAVRARVEQKRAQNPEAIAIIGVHPAAQTDTLVNVVNAAREAGIERVSVDTYKD